MNGREAAVVDRTELIKWWDAKDVLLGRWLEADVEKGLKMARECRHPDAQWLASLFLEGVAWTHQQMAEVMREQGDDPRALYLFLLLSRTMQLEHESLWRSAEMGYAPAQAALSICLSGENRDNECLFWARRAEAQGDREGMFRLGLCYGRGTGCAQDTGKSIALFKEAATLGCPPAMVTHSWHSVNSIGSDTTG
jgi:hypothetical protein